MLLQQRDTLHAIYIKADFTMDFYDSHLKFFCLSTKYTIDMLLTTFFSSMSNSKLFTKYQWDIKNSKYSSFLSIYSSVISKREELEGSTFGPAAKEILFKDIVFGTEN